MRTKLSPFIIQFGNQKPKISFYNQGKNVPKSLVCKKIGNNGKVNFYLKTQQDHVQEKKRQVQACQN